MADKEIDASDAEVVYEKTQKGLAEIETRKNNLPQKLRTFLIVVNGQKTLATILKELPKIEGARAAIEELEQKGFIVKASSVPAPDDLSRQEEARKFTLAQTFMVNTTLDSVGPMGSALVENLRKCENLQQLRDHVENYLYAIKSGRGASTAEEYEQEIAKFFSP
ncbi:MAG TPA: hypothetical protein VK654_13380 [Nitrospirota bacterium]|nr:hypothetical protein [Nitrospirota bacterium]